MNKPRIITLCIIPLLLLSGALSAQNISVAHSTVFARLICEFLKGNGVDLSIVRFQYDNSSEFIGNIYAKELSDLEKILKSYGADINRIPEGQWSWNSDVETTHGIIERVFRYRDV